MQHSRDLQQTIELAQQLIRIPSANPPGNEHRIASFARQWLHEHGIEAQQLALEPGRSSVVARVPGRGQGSIVLCGHLDTVSTDESAWDRPPFDAQIAENRLWGLGAADMKSGVAVLMQAAAFLVRQGITPPRDIVLALTADEEWGYRGAQSIAASGLIDDAELLLIAEPTEGRVHSGQKGELWIEVIFEGKAAHGSMPETGVSTILPAAQFVLELQRAIEQLPPSSQGNRTSINIGRFDGGSQVNVVPDRASIQLDVRVAEPAHYDVVLEAIQTIGKDCSTGGCRFSYRIMSYHPPIICKPDHAFADALLAELADGHAQDALLPMTPYSTDAVSVVSGLHCTGPSTQRVD